MELDCTQIARNSSIRIERDLASRPARVHLVFLNATATPLWFPAEPAPAFRQDERAGTLLIWFGYFDEVYGPSSGQYIVPPMRLAEPGARLRIELTLPALTRHLLDERLAPSLKARVATKRLAESRNRGEQPITDYLEHSCLIEGGIDR